MAIGKGSLQRAASAAKNTMKLEESGAAENVVKAKESDAAENAGKAKAAGAAENAGKAKAAGAVENAGKAKAAGAAENAGKAKAAGAAENAGKAEKSGTVKKTVRIEQGLWIAYVKTEQLCEIPDEWRGPKYVRPNVSMLAESISRCGILEPLPVVQIEKETYQLVGGSRRMEVVKMLGIGEVPVVVLPGTTLEEAHHYYEEMKPYTDAAQDTMHNAKFRTAALFGAQRIPEYLL